MNYSVIAIPKFNKELKKLVKKYPSLKADFTKLLDSLVFNPMQGKPLGKIVTK